MKKFQSKYSPDKTVTELQYICEIICEKNAAQTGKSLPIQFWKLPQWAAFYKFQLRECSKLLKVFSSDAILKALRDKRADKIYSLRAPWLIKVIQEYQNKLDVVVEVVETEVGGNNFIRPQNKKTLMDKLNE